MRTKNPLVSIIIDNYNYGRFLKEAIDSAIDQAYQDKEIIVVDDGSTDGSSEIILSYDNKVIPILKENGGQASAFNAGFKASRGEIIIFLDSDDALLPTAVEKAVKIFENDPTVVKVHWPLWKIDADGEKTGGILPESFLIEGNLRDRLIKNGPSDCGGPPNSPPTSGNAWSRQYLQEVFPMPTPPVKQVAPDYYLMVLAPLYGKIKKLDEQPLGLYRVHGNNVTLSADYLEKFVYRFEDCCLALSKFLSKSGMDVSPSIWPRNHWYHLIYDSIKDIERIVPAGNKFILADGNDWGSGETIADRRRILFMEQNGKYWGLPDSDEQAINELEQQKIKGSSTIVFVWTSFWMLDHYKGMSKHLEENYNCVLKNERLIGFSLTKTNNHF